MTVAFVHLIKYSPMKKIECFIQPIKWDELEDALWEGGVAGVTVTGVRGFGSQRVRTGPRLLDKLKIEIFIRDEQVDEIISIIRKVTHTGKLGDGKIAILPADDLMRIRTGEKGDEAI